MMWGLSVTLTIWCCAAFAVTLPVEKKASKQEVFGMVGKEPKGLAALTNEKSQGKSSRFYGGMPPFLNPTGGLFPNAQSPYNYGGFQPPPYFSPYGYMSGPGPMSYGNFYPVNPNFYGNSFGQGFGGFTSSQQQQQVSQIGTSGLQPTFSG